MDAESVPSSQRRKFLMVMAAGLGGAVAAVAAWPLFRFLAPINSGGASSKVSISRNEVPVGAAHFFQYRGRPAVVVQKEVGQFVAMSAVCTHLGCVVSWQQEKSEFLCPCHGGRFSAEGQVLGGPPPSPLEQLTVAVEGDQVLVG